MLGQPASSLSGLSVSTAGDVNGDGFDDLLIGEPPPLDFVFYDAIGKGYVVYGGASLGSMIDLATLGSAGVTIRGNFADQVGKSVSAAGDVNGDGFDDLILGAPLGGGNTPSTYDRGESTVIFGGPALPSLLTTGTLPIPSTRIFGATTLDRSGYSVSDAGDINGDGFDDLIVSAIFADAAGDGKLESGESYILYGGNGFTSSVTHLGSPASETLTGTSAANVMVGNRGNDTIIGDGGADIILAGQGNDLITISDLGFKRINGGTGIDTLRLNTSSIVLDLTAIPANRLFDVEVIDITGTGNNTLTLSARDVFNLSEQSNLLTVRGNVGDIVGLDRGWTRGANRTIGPDTFQVYTQGAAILRVSLAVSVRATTIDLETLSTSGMTIVGADAGDFSGRSVSNAGDVNGDGYDDLLIGAYQADGTGNTRPGAGDSYVIFGSAAPPAFIDLGTIGTVGGPAGVTIFGVNSNDTSGGSVSGAAISTAMASMI